MLNRDTIDRLQEEKTCETLNTAVANGVDAIAMPDGYSIKDFEPYLRFRRRMRGSMKTPFLKDFNEYVVKESKDEAPQVFINPADMQAIAIFNIGSTSQPGHCDHTATLELKATAAFSAMRANCNMQLTQKSLGAWIEDWRSSLTFEDSKEKPMSYSAALTGVRNITIEKAVALNSNTGNLSESRGVLESIDANSGGFMPGWITLKCTPYPGLQERSFLLEISILTGGEKPGLKLRLVREEEALEQIADEFKENIKAEIGGVCTAIYNGKYDPNPRG